MRRKKLFTRNQSIEMNEFLENKIGIKIKSIGTVLEVSWGDEIAPDTPTTEPKIVSVDSIHDWDDTLPMVNETLKEQRMY